AAGLAGLAPGAPGAGERLRRRCRGRGRGRAGGSRRTRRGGSAGRTPRSRWRGDGGERRGRCPRPRRRAGGGESALDAARLRGGGYALPAASLAVLADRARQAGVAVFRRAVHSLAAVEPLADRVLVAAGCATPGLLGDAWPSDRPARTRRIRYAILDAGTERL